MGSKNPTFSISARRVVLPETVTNVDKNCYSQRVKIAKFPFGGGGGGGGAHPQTPLDFGAVPVL